MTAFPDTIYALSTAPGRAGIAVIRVSGGLSGDFIASLTGQAPPEPRHAVLRDLAHDSVAIDRALVLYFAAPASFTGEDMAEFHIHGSRAVTLSLGKALQSLGARPAAPGEFTKRAFLAGKIDLTEAEAIADLIDAESAAQQAQALAQAGGALSRLYENWSARLLRLLAHVEASLDFADEELPDNLAATVARDVIHLRAEIVAHLADARRGERLRQGVQIAILGAPNAGKSSLLNALAERDIAIVSARAGTTRDVIEAHLDLGGYPVIVADTAGLRDRADEIEGEGIARARARAGTADIRLLLFDAAMPPDAETLALRDETSLVVWTKIDTASHVSDPPGGGEEIAISVQTGEGLQNLLRILTEKVAEQCGDLSRPAPTRERHTAHLRTAEQALAEFACAPTPDLAAEGLRIALRVLGGITGRVDVEDLLDVVFHDFCIGK